VAGTDSELIWADEDFLLENKVAPWTEMPLWLPEKTPLGPEHNEPWSGAFHINIDKALQTGLRFRPLAETIREVHDWLNAKPITETSWKAGITSEREKRLLDSIVLKQ
jgi:2'-hydroxyisoflavone reductase